MNLRTLQSYILIAFLITLSGCGKEPATNPSPSVTLITPTVVLNITGTEVSEVTVETASQSNCGGSAEVENTIERSRSIQHLIEVQGGFSVNANGQVGFAGTDVELGATIASQLGYTYGTVDNIARSITLKAKSGTNMQHSIKQEEIWKVGTAKIIIGSQETTIPFKFRDDFNIELIGSKDLGCNNLQPTSSLNPSVDTPTPNTVIKSCNEIGGAELLSKPWHLEAENGDAQMYQELDHKALQGKTMLSVVYNLHGLRVREGERKDESAIIFDQPYWFVVSLANYGKNGLDGEQMVLIPLSDFVGLPDVPSGVVGGAHLNINAPIGTLHTRFWRAEHFVVDITSICVYP
jgi:hypothetical protein